MEAPRTGTPSPYSGEARAVPTRHPRGARSWSKHCRVHDTVPRGRLAARRHTHGVTTVVSWTYPTRTSLQGPVPSRSARDGLHAQAEQQHLHHAHTRRVHEVEALVVASDEPEDRVEERAGGIHRALSATGRERGSRRLHRTAGQGRQPTAEGPSPVIGSGEHPVDRSPSPPRSGYASCRSSSSSSTSLAICRRGRGSSPSPPRRGPRRPRARSPSPADLLAERDPRPWAWGGCHSLLSPVPATTARRPRRDVSGRRNGPHLRTSARADVGETDARRPRRRHHRPVTPVAVGQANAPGRAPAVRRTHSRLRRADRQSEATGGDRDVACAFDTRYRGLRQQRKGGWSCDATALGPERQPARSILLRHAFG